MKNNKPTVTIGIPAYNEEANIKQLLNSLLDQKQDTFVLKDILVISDGSSDKTVQEARSVNVKRVKVIESKKRLGKAERENEIVNLSKSDVLILLDADVLIVDLNFIQKLILPIVQKKADLVSCKILSLKSSNLFEAVISFGTKFKNIFFESLYPENAVYLCHGRVRAFSKDLYKKIKWPNAIGEDAYSFFFCMKNNLRFYYQKNASLFFRSPSNMRDHEKQSVRFIHSKKRMAQLFGENYTESFYKIRYQKIFRTCLTFLLRNPLFTISYIVIFLYTQFLSTVKKSKNDLWSLSYSSKKLV